MEYILIWRSVSVKACSGSNYERWPVSSGPLQTDESIAHLVTALQGFPAAADRYKFKAERCPKLDPVTRAMELQYHFTI